MKQHLTYLFFISIHLLYSCGNTNRDNFPVNTDTVDWKNQNECLSNLDNYNFDSTKWEHIELDFYKSKQDNNIYYLTCENDWGAVFMQLEYDIDFDTYTVYGEYAADKHSVFYFYRTSDGRKLIKLDTCDRHTFKSFDSTQYAKDKNFIYWRGSIINGADLKTFSVIDFKTENPIPPLARDKNHIYVWDKILEDTGEIEGLKQYLYLQL